MKTISTLKKKCALAALFATLLAAPAMAQSAAPPEPGSAGGRGMAPCGQGAGPCANNGGMGMGMGMGGMGGRGGGRGMQFNQRNTGGWNLMTPDERIAHRQKMMSASNYEECKSIQTAHHLQMAERAKEKGVALPGAPRYNMCDRMKARGVIQ